MSRRIRSVPAAVGVPNNRLRLARWSRAFSRIAISVLCSVFSLGLYAQITTDITAPGTVAAQGPITFVVFFGEPVTGFDTAADVNVLVSGSAAVGTVVVSSTSQQDYSVELSAISGDGTLQLTVPAGVATSTTTTDTNLAQSSPVITVDNTAPTVVAGSLSRSFASTANSSPITFDVSFAGASSAEFSASEVAVASTGTAAATISTTTSFGAAIQVDATASRPHDPHFDIDPGAGLTLEVWIKPPSGPPSFIVNYDEFSGYGMQLVPGSSADRMNLTCSLGLQDFTTTNSPVRVGVWQHVACTVGGGDVRLYVDSVEQGSFGGWAGTLTYGTAGLTVGDNPFNPFSWSAQVDELRIWSVTRTQAELSAGMIAPLAGSQPGLLGSWQFDVLEDLGVGPNGGASDVRDVSGNLKHLDTGVGTSLVPGNALFGATVSLSNFAGDGSLDLSLVPGIAVDLAGNQSTAVTITPAITVAMGATAPQIVSITPSVASPTNADAVSFRVVFSEAVTGFAADDLIVAAPAGSIASSAITPVDSSNYDVLISGIAGDGSLTLGVRSGAVQNSGLLFNTSEVTSGPVVIDNTSPTPTLSSAASSPLDGSPFSVNIDFDEPVTGLTIGAVGVGNGALSALTGSGSSYAVTVTPTTFGEVTVGPLLFGSVLDLAGNGNIQGNALTFSYPVPDTTPPEIARVTPTGFATTPEFSLVIEFTEAVVGFDRSDLDLTTTGTASYATAALTTLTSTAHQLDITGSAGQGDLVIRIGAGKLNDLAGNPNALLTITRQIDHVAPGVASSSVFPSSSAGAGVDISFTIRADETLGAYDLSRIEVVATGGAGFEPLPTGRVTTNSNVFTIDVKHTGDGILSLELRPGALIDRAGIASTLTFSTPRVTVDNTLPQVLSFEPEIRDRQLGPDVVYFEGVLSEPVSYFVERGVAVEYEFLAVSNASYPADLTSLVRIGNSELVTPERFRIPVDLSRVPRGADFNLWLVVDPLLIADNVLNRATVRIRSGSPAIVDLLQPSVTISTRRTPTSESPIPIEVRFTSAALAGFPADVTGLDLSDLNITNGTASNLTGSGSDYRFDLTPTAEGEITFWIPAGAVRDAENRPNQRSELISIDYDITAPSIGAVEAKVTGNPNNDPSFLVYVEVSEPLDRFSLASAVFSNLVTTGSLVSEVDDPGIDVPGVEVVRITHLPGGEGTVTFSVPAGAVTDLAGNLVPTLFALPEPISVDLAAPIASPNYSFVPGSNPIDPMSDSISASEVTAEFLFSEPVVGLETGDFLIDRDGPLSFDDVAVESLSPTLARLTLLGISGDGVLGITLREDGVSDPVGNGVARTSLSINVNNIATEVVSITPDSLETATDRISFVVEWSKPVSAFDPGAISLAGAKSFLSPVVVERIEITPIDALRFRVDLLELSGAGQFVMNVGVGAAVDRFNNPNFDGATSPVVRRLGALDVGPFSILGGETDEFGDIVGLPDLIINGVFALRATESSPARLSWDGRILTLDGRFEVLTDPVMVLFETLGSLSLGIDSETGEFVFHSSISRDLTLGGAPNSFIPCEARLVLDDRALRLSGTLFPGEGFIRDALLDPRDPSNGIVLDVLSVFHSSSSCTPAGLGFEVLGSEPTTAGLAVDVRAHWDLVGDGDDEPALIEGRIELRGGGSQLLTGFTARISDFDWQAPDAREPTTGGPTLSRDVLQFPRLMREQAGLLLLMDGLEIASDLSVAVPETLVATAPCNFAYDPDPDADGNTQTGQEAHCYYDAFLSSARKVVLSMYDPTFGKDEFGRGRISSTDSEPMGTGQPRTRAVVAGPEANEILLPDTHTLQLGTSATINVPDTCVTGCGAAGIDGTAYRAPAFTVHSGLGEFRYGNVAIFHDLRLSEGTSLSSPAAGAGLDIGGQKVTGFDLPFRITALNCVFGATNPPCRDELELGVTVGLPTDFQIQESATTTFPFNGEINIKVVAAQGTWCTLMLPAKIPYVDFQINPFCLTYEEPPPTWSGEMQALLPVLFPPLRLSGELTLKNEKWDSFYLEMQRVPRGAELPIGNTGAFLAGVGVGLANMAQEETCVEVRDSASIGGWEERCSVEPIEFRGTVFLQAGPLVPVRPLFAPVTIRINKDRININGDVFLFHPLTGLKMGNANGTLTFAGPSFLVKSSQTTFPALEATANVGIGNLYINGSLVATLKVPEPIPVIGGETISEIGMVISTTPRYIKGYFTIFGIGFSATINSSPQLVFEKGSTPLRSWEGTFAYQVDAEGGIQTFTDEASPSYVMFENFSSATKQYYERYAPSAVSTVDIGSSSPAMVRLSWETEGAVPEFTLIGPDGTRFSRDTVETNPNVAAPVGYIRNLVARDATYLFNAPTPGSYLVEVGNAEALGEYAIEVLVQNAPPSFEFVNVVATGDQLFLDWTAEDSDDDAQITFYLDRDREDSNGRLLAGPFSEDSQTMTAIELAALTIAPGSYWIYALVDDGANAPQIVYSSEPIFIVNPDAPPAVRGIQVVASETTAIVEWEPSADPGITGYAVKWTEEIDQDTYENSLSVQPHLNFAVVSGLTPNTTYKFTVVAIKGASDIGKRLATLRDVRDAAEGRGVNDPSGLVYLDDQIARLAASMKGRQMKPSTNLNAFRFEQIIPSRTPLEDMTPYVESLVAEFDIVETIARAGRNNVPEFLSEPARTVMSSGMFQYEVELRDRDGDALSLSVVEGPEGMTLENRHLSWTPAGEQGVFAVTLEASDGVATRTQSWKLTSAGLFADQLRIPARDVGIVPPGEPFAFPIETLGGCGSPISYRLLTAPEGMTIDEEGLVEWLPPSTGGEDARFVVEASQVCNDRVIKTSRQYSVDLEAADGDEGQIVPVPATCADGPTATLSGPWETDLDRIVDIEVDLTGTAPWFLLWTDGEIQENIQSSPAVRTVPNRRGATYSLEAVIDARCSGTVSGTIVLEGPEKPPGRKKALGRD